MVATTIQDMKKKADNFGLVRKIQNAVAFLAPVGTALPEKMLTAEGKLEELPAAFLPVGLVTPSGYEYGTETETAEVEALGYMEPVRKDIVKVTKSVTFTAYETFKKHVLELIKGVDLSAVKQDPASGEIVFDEPAVPINREYVLVIIGQDGPPEAEWIVGRAYPRVKLEELPVEVWSKEDAVQSEIKLSVFNDSTVGTAVRHFIGGTGAVEHKDALGFEQAPGA